MKCLAFLTLAVGLILPDRLIGQRDSEERKDVQAVSLRLKVTAQVGRWPLDPYTVEMLYARGRRWRITVRRKDSHAVAISDGKTAWRYDSATGKVQRWDLARLVKELGEEGAYRQVMDRHDFAEKAVAPFNPTLEPWRKEFFVPPADLKTLKVSEEKLGDTATVVLTEGGSGAMRVWYGKADGILRRQVVYQQDDSDLMRWEVEAIDKDPRLDEAAFQFRLPKGATVQDETDELIRKLKE